MATRPRHQNLKPPGKCIFCGRTAGQREPDGKRIKMTKEHAWPDWVGEIIPLKADSHMTITSEAHDTGRQNEQIKNHQGDLSQRKVRNICNICNNGWMSRLEQREAKPILTPMILGHELTLGDREIKIIVKWISKRGLSRCPRFIKI